MNPVLVKVAQRTQPKKLAAFMRKLIDYIIFTLPQPMQPEHIENVRIDHVISKYDLVILKLTIYRLLADYES